jgi:hypothetical protein
VLESVDTSAGGVRFENVWRGELGERRRFVRRRKGFSSTLRRRFAWSLSIAS